MSYESAESLIKSSFPEINDRLRNLLELHKNAEALQEDEIFLLQAAVEQKILSLGDLHFAKRIPLRKSFYRLRWTWIPILCLGLGFIFFPESTTFPARRILHYQEHFEKPLPFAFEVLTSDLLAVKGEDFYFRVKSVGKEIPDEVFVNLAGRRFRMEREDKLHFAYRFARLQKSFTFQLQIADYLTMPYSLEVRPLPALFAVEVRIDYPAYTGRAPEVLQQLSDMQLPRGSRLGFRWRTKDTDSLYFWQNERKLMLLPDEQGRLTHAVGLTEDLRCALLLSNRYASAQDTLFFGVQCIEDQYPAIFIEEFKDSTTPQFRYFKGLIRDDYGFSSLQMVIIRKKESQDTLRFAQAFDAGRNSFEFVEHFDFQSLLTEDGLRFSYYFEVFDNDAISGFKSARSELLSYAPLTLAEREDAMNRSSEALVDRLEQSVRKVQEQQKSLENLLRKMLDKSEPSWDDKHQFELLQQEQQRLLEEHSKLKDDLARQLDQQMQQSEEEQRILEKKEQLEDLFDQVYTPEMKKMMEEIQQLMLQEMSKDKLERSMQQIQLNNKDIEKQLDQNLEIFKRMEVERQMGQVLERLDRLKESVEKLRNEAGENGADGSKIEKKQEQLRQDFKVIQDQLSGIEKLQKELEEPLSFERSQQKERSIEQRLEQAQRKQKEGNHKGAQEERERVEEELEALREDLAAQMDAAEEQESGEDADKIRRLLKRIVQTSLDQEKNLRELKQIRVNDPRYADHLRKQSRLTEATRSLADSLYALGKRQPQVATVVNAEVKIMEQHSAQVMQDLKVLNDVMYQRSALYNSPAVSREQYVMTSLNNLSLLLAESLKQMEERQSKSKSRSKKNSSSCPNPSSGQGKSQAPSVREMQESLNRQLEQMRKGEMQQQLGGSKMSEQLARAAAQQEAIRRLLQKQAEQLSRKDGKAAGELRSIMEEMEKTERELVNRRFSEQSLQRQSRILTRLLESERAQMKEGQEERRRSTEAKSISGQIPAELLEYQKTRTKEVELMQKYHLILSPYYQQKTQEYFNKPNVPRETKLNP